MMSLNYLTAQDQIFKAISSMTQKHEILITNLTSHIYINRINNRLVFKIKDRYNLESQTHEAK